MENHVMHALLTSLRSCRASVARLAHTCAFAAAWICAAPACAQQPTGEGKPETSSWGVGLAAVSAQQAYKGTNRDTTALPILSFENRYLKLSVQTLEIKLPGLELGDSQRLNFGVVARLFGGGGYEAGDSPFLAGMAQRRSSVWVGPRAEWKTALADVKLELLGDASGNSKGRRVLLGVERKWVLGPSVVLVPQVGAEWVDRKYVDYYFGVRAGEATAARAAYAGEAAVNAEIGLTGIYAFDRNNLLTLNVSVKSLGDEIKSSPIVDRSTENRVLLAYTYRF
jgi:outer membrane protein